MKIFPKGKVAIAAGTSSGIEFAVIRSYLDSGARGVVAVFRRNEAPLAQSIYGDRLVIVRGDVFREETTAGFAKAAIELASFFTGSILLMDGGSTAQ